MTITTIQAKTATIPKGRETKTAARQAMSTLPQAIVLNVSVVITGLPIVSGIGIFRQLSRKFPSALHSLHKKRKRQKRTDCDYKPPATSAYRRNDRDRYRQNESGEH